MEATRILPSQYLKAGASTFKICCSYFTRSHFSTEMAAILDVTISQWLITRRAKSRVTILNPIWVNHFLILLPLHNVSSIYFLRLRRTKRISQSHTPFRTLGSASEDFRGIQRQKKVQAEEMVALSIPGMGQGQYFLVIIMVCTKASYASADVLKSIAKSEKGTLCLFPYRGPCRLPWLMEIPTASPRKLSFTTLVQIS